jgi:MFS family permease
LCLAAVVGLNAADMAAVSATADNLEQTFGFGNTDFGLLLSVVALAAAAFTVPAGILTDRIRRTRLLAATLVLWSAAMVACGAATSFTWLIASRAFLGAGLAAAGPAVASLTGDFFPARDRGRIYGLILGGELAGTGVGFLVSGEIAGALSWRYAFWWLALPAIALAWALWKLPEPPRGGQRDWPAGAPDRDCLAQRAISGAGVEPDPDLVLPTDPAHRSTWWAVRYVLRVRSNVVIIVASALGYFFFAALGSFALLFSTGHYGISKRTADTFLLVLAVGALGGVFAGGRVSDRMLRRGKIRARVLVPAVCLLAAAPLFAGAIATTSVALALPLLTLGAALLGAANPPMDAARLDVMHPGLWGRAEAVRTVLRTLSQAGAPALFGYVSQYVFASGTPGVRAGAGGSAGSSGLEYTFLLFLVLLAGAGLLVLPALRTYPRDVATARASARSADAFGRRGGPG